MIIFLFFVERIFAIIEHDGELGSGAEISLDISRPTDVDLQCPELDSSHDVSCSNNSTIGSICKIKCPGGHLINPNIGGVLKCTSGGTAAMPNWIGSNSSFNESMKLCLKNFCPKIRPKLKDIESWKCSDRNYVKSDCLLTCPEEYLVYGFGF